MSSPQLSISGLSKTFPTPRGQGMEVLRSVDLRVETGEFISLIGPSGSGKSTLLQIIAGLEEPSSGTIHISGQSANQRLGSFGYAMQKPLLLPWKTVRENVMLGPTIGGQSRVAAQSAADDLLARFGLAEAAHQYPAALSGGMAQRAALLRTVLYNRVFLLLDEPFGALDALTRLAMQLWLLEMQREFKSTVLCVTHDIREAILLSDRIYVLGRPPTGIVKEIVVTLPRPRSRGQLSQAPALALERKLESLLLGMESSQ